MRNRHCPLEFRFLTNLLVNGKCMTLGIELLLSDFVTDIWFKFAGYILLCWEQNPKPVRAFQQCF